jgi:hypothetical protein
MTIGANVLEENRRFIREVFLAISKLVVWN